jgi:hypothetical protein
MTIAMLEGREDSATFDFRCWQIVLQKSKIERYRKSRKS